MLLLPLQVLLQKLVLLAAHVQQTRQLLLHLTVAFVLLAYYLHLAVYFCDVVVSRTVGLLTTVCSNRVRQTVRIGLFVRHLLHFLSGLLDDTVQSEGTLIVTTPAPCLLTVPFTLLQLVQFSVTQVALEEVCCVVAALHH
jgi:hypothetical protein